MGSGLRQLRYRRERVPAIARHCEITPCLSNRRMAQCELSHLSQNRFVGGVESPLISSRQRVQAMRNLFLSRSTFSVSCAPVGTCIRKARSASISCSARNVALRRRRASSGATMLLMVMPTAASSAPIRARNARARPLGG
jgi:hypothetical protein